MTTTLRDAFLQDIVEHPADDTPRLIFADWLDEQGDADRADFIRGQVALERLDPANPRRVALVTATADLLKAHREEWDEPLRQMVTDTTYRRGFVAEVGLSSTQFLCHAAAIVRLAPIEGIALDATAADFDHLLETALFRRVDRLEVRGAGLGDEGVERLVRSPFHGHYRSLILHHCGLTPRSGRLLRQLPLDRLAHLNLGANDLGDTGMDLLCGHPDLTELEYLGLGGNELGPPSARSIASAPALRRLRKLNLGANYLDGEAVAGLAGTARLATLTELDLRYNEFGDDGATALAGSPYLEHLSRLDVTENAIGPRGLEALRDRFGVALQS